MQIDFILVYFPLPLTTHLFLFGEVYILWGICAYGCPLRLEMVGLPGRASEVAELVRKRDTICIYDAVMFQLLLARRTAVTKRSFELVLCFSTFGLHGL